MRSAQRTTPGLLATSHAAVLFALSLAACGPSTSQEDSGTSQEDSGTTADSQVSTDSGTPIVDAGPAMFLRLVARDRHTCALYSNGVAQCWGRNVDGELGNGTTGENGARSPVMGLSEAVQVAPGASHMCARRSNGTLACWGSNFTSALGDGSMTRATAGPVPGVSDAIDVSAGGMTSCAVRMNGEVMCWGRNSIGVGPPGGIGDGTSELRTMPTRVSGLADAVQVVQGSLIQGDFMCARRMTGAVMCWGAGSSGVLGNGVEPSAPYAEPALVPVAVVGLTDAVELSAGDSHVCARRMNGTAVCWGSNFNRTIGTSMKISSANSPVPVEGLTGVVQLAAGGEITCARRMDGTVVCWGLNSSGALGSPGDMTSTPRAVTGITNAIDVTAGYNFACATLADHSAVCWGSNDFRQIVDSDTTRFPEPTPIPGL